MVLLAVTPLVAHPVLTNHAPTVETAEIEALQLYGLTLADICDTGEGGNPHVHCDACLADVLGSTFGGFALAQTHARASETFCLHRSVWSSRQAEAAHPIRAPPVI